MTVPRDFDSFAMSPLAREDMAFQSDMSYYAHPPNKRTLSEDSSLFFGLNNGKHQKMDSEDSGIVPTIDFDIDQLSFASGIVPNHIGIVPQTEGINPLQLCQPMMSEDMPSVPQIKTESPEDDEHTSPVFSDTDDDSDNSLSSPSLPLTASTSRPEQYRQKHTERLPPINRRTASSGTIARYKAKKKETKTNAERRCRAFQKENLVRFRDAQILPEEVFQFVSHHTDRDSRLPLALLLAQEVQRLEEGKQPSEAFDDRFYKTGGLSSYVLDATGTRKTHKLDEDIQHHLKSAESLPRDLLRSIRDHLNQYSRLPADRQQQYLQQFDLMKLRSSMDAYPKNGWATNMKYRADYQFFRAFLDNRYPKKADNLDAASCLRRVQPEFKATAKIISFLYIQYLVKN